MVTLSYVSVLAFWVPANEKSCEQKAYSVSQVCRFLLQVIGTVRTGRDLPKSNQRQIASGLRATDDLYIASNCLDRSCSFLPWPLEGRRSPAEYPVLGFAAGTSSPRLECPRTERSLPVEGRAERISRGCVEADGRHTWSLGDLSERPRESGIGCLCLAKLQRGRPGTG